MTAICPSFRCSTRTCSSSLSHDIACVDPSFLVASPLSEREICKNSHIFLSLSRKDPLCAFSLQRACRHARMCTVGAAFVTKNEMIALSRLSLFSPCFSFLLFSLTCSDRFFFRVHWTDTIARLMVMIPTFIPLSCSQRSQCSWNVASGCASNCARIFVRRHAPFTEGRPVIFVG
jgi:hypothetical protein